MTWNIDAEIKRFASFPEKAAAHLRVESVCEYGFAVMPADYPVNYKGRKKFGLTILGLTHGNELSGVAVLNSLLALINEGGLRIDYPVVFALGNPWAARENKRFLERDLNRSFNRTQNTLFEEKRADVLEEILDESAFLVDFHQVSRPSDRPFFIFPYNRPAYKFARQIMPAMTMVTHWGDSFSAEGMCTDEYVNSKGGLGISIELGQNGFALYQISAGIESGIKAISLVGCELRGQAPDPFSQESEGNCGELYKWAEIIDWPATGTVILREGWNNFDSVAAGQEIGTVDGIPIRVKEEGRMLFPKYLTVEQQAQLSTRPTELCRIMKPIAVSALPKD